MAVTGYRVLKAPIDQIERFMAEAIADGWQPLGAPLILPSSDKDVHQAIIKGTPDGGGGGAAPEIGVDDITGAGAVGKVVLSAEDAETARDAIGAGVPYTLPEAGSAIGGVKQGAAVADSDAEDAGGVNTVLNALLASLRASGAIAS